MNLNSLAADFIVVIHFAYVSFVVLGWLAIVAGIALRWQWIRNFWFRVVHLAMIMIVVVEALTGITCPLTTWEHELRAAAGETVQAGSFMAQWAHRLLFLHGPAWGFTLAYCVFGGLVLASFWLAPPRRPQWRLGRQDAP